MTDANKIKTLVLSGASRRQIATALGHALTPAEITVMEQARLAVKLAAAQRRLTKGTAASAADRVAASVSRRNEIGDIPLPANPERRESCRHNLPLFLKTYFPETFTRPFCPASLRFLADVESILTDSGGNKKVIAMPRGGGKSSMLLDSLLWAALYAHKRYVLLVSASATTSKRLMKNLTTGLQSRPILEDFPAVAYPLRALDGKWQKAKHQRYHGQPTAVELTASQIVFPTVGAETDGIVIGCTSITANFRGMSHVCADGSTRRPEVVLIDDPQSRKDAQSASAVDRLEELIQADILGLASADSRPLSVFMGCTVIARGDLAERFLDLKAKPDWRGQRESLVSGFGEDEQTRWLIYDSLWRDEQAGRVPPGTCTEFFKEHRETLEKGIKVMDENLFSPDECSPVQRARNKFLEMGAAAFASEMQNRPLDLRETEYTLEPEEVLEHLNGRKRYEIPDDSIKVVAGIDLNRYAAAYCVASQNGVGSLSIIDYGFWTPKGRHQLWEDGENKEQKLSEAINAVAASLFGNPAYGEALDVVAVDAGYSSQTVYSTVQALQGQYRHRRIYAARGLPGDRYDLPRNRKLLITYGDGCDVRRAIPSNVIFYWDSHHHHIRIQKSFKLAHGCIGESTIFGTLPEVHRAFAEQVTADVLISTATAGNGRTVAKWETNRHNEMGDCLAMCSAAASIGIGKVHKPGKPGTQPQEGAKDAGTNNGPVRSKAPSAQEGAVRRLFTPLARSRNNWAVNW